MLEKTMGKNWRTSMWGIVSGLAAFIAFYPGVLEPLPDYWEGLIEKVAAFIMAGGLIKLGFSAPDLKESKEVSSDIKQEIKGLQQHNVDVEQEKMDEKMDEKN